jgi:hypothetical protein
MVRTGLVADAPRVESAIGKGPQLCLSRCASFSGSSSAIVAARRSRRVRDQRKGVWGSYALRPGAPLAAHLSEPGQQIMRDRGDGVVVLPHGMRTRSSPCTIGQGSSRVMLAPVSIDAKDTAFHRMHTYASVVVAAR